MRKFSRAGRRRSISFPLARACAVALPSHGYMAEELENRLFLSAGSASAARLSAALLAIPSGWQANPNVANGAASPAGESAPFGLSPATIRRAYGDTGIQFGTVAGNGSGQTIDIIAAYGDPDALGDLNAFSGAYALPKFNSGSGTATFSQLNEYGAASPLPGPTRVPRLRPLHQPVPRERGKSRSRWTLNGRTHSPRWRTSC